jgi:hypothetical protein
MMMVKVFEILKNLSLSLSDYITNILSSALCKFILRKDDKESFDLNELLENIIELINIKHDW